MKLKEKISWLMGRVQWSLFPHLNECLKTPLTAQEKRLVSILEIVQVERGMFQKTCLAIVGLGALPSTGKAWPERSWPRRSIAIRDQ